MNRLQTGVRYFTVFFTLITALLKATPAFAKCDVTKNPNGCPVNNGQIVVVDAEGGEGGVGAGQVGQQLTQSGSVSITLRNGNTSNGNAFGLVGNTLTNSTVAQSGNTITGQSQSGATVTLVLFEPAAENTDELITDDIVTDQPVAVLNVVAPKSPNQPQVADCSLLQGTTLPAPATKMTVEQMRVALNWSWKPGPTDGWNHIRNTNGCIRNGNSTNWSPVRAEPGNCPTEACSYVKLQRYTDLYNAGNFYILQ